MRAMFRRRPAPLGAALAVLLSVALLSLLFLPAKDEDNLRLVLDWRPEVEPLLLVANSLQRETEHPPLSQVFQASTCLLQPLGQERSQPCLRLTQPLPHLLVMGGHEFGSFTGGQSSTIGHQVGDGHVDFVADRRHHRDP